MCHQVNHPRSLLIKVLYLLNYNAQTLADNIALFSHNYHSRKALKSLDTKALQDIGMTQADANKESIKPFWCYNEKH